MSKKILSYFPSTKTRGEQFNIIYNDDGNKERKETSISIFKIIMRDDIVHVNDIIIALLFSA